MGIFPNIITYTFGYSRPILVFHRVCYSFRIKKNFRFNTQNNSEVSNLKFLPRDALVHSAVLRLHVVRLSVCPSVCDVGGSGSHRLEILETNCTVN